MCFFAEVLFCKERISSSSSRFSPSFPLSSLPPSSQLDLDSPSRARLGFTPYANPFSTIPPRRSPPRAHGSLPLLALPKGLCGQGRAGWRRGCHLGSCQDESWSGEVCLGAARGGEQEDWEGGRSPFGGDQETVEGRRTRVWLVER